MTAHETGRRVRSTAADYPEHLISHRKGSPPVNADPQTAIAEHHIVAEWICCEPLDPKHELCAKGYAALDMVKTLLVDNPEAWNPAAPLLDAVLAVLPPPAVPVQPGSRQRRGDRGMSGSGGSTGGTA